MNLKKIFSPPATDLFSQRFVLLFLLAGLLIASVSGCQQQTSARKTDIAPEAREAALFKSKCSKCHTPEMAMKEYRSREVWLETIRRMKEEHQADITGAEIEILVNFHVERQKQEAAIFEEKCQKCHPGKVFLEQNLTPELARAIIKRMQQKAGNTIEDSDVEIIVRYHARSHQAALEENIRGVFNQVSGTKTNSSGTVPAAGMTLFLEKCSACHEPRRAMAVTKDPEIWAQTIKRMQYYSKGEITDQEARELVDFHVTEQQREINTFQSTCTKCHDDERINSLSLSEEQWLGVIKRMQKKAPDLISDEKINILAAYFHRRELTLARIFYGKCQLCHLEQPDGTVTPYNASGHMEGLIVLANQEFGDSLQVTDIKRLHSIHVQRQKRDMQIFARNCSVCHPDGIPGKRKTAERTSEKRTRAEWISFIATLQGMELNKDVQISINSLINHHIANR